MYGKWFDSAYTGSLYGAGADVFAVMSYVVAHAQNAQVELNPILMANSMGMPVESVNRAIEFLCQPDPQSRNPEHEGRRLIFQSGFQYQVVSQPFYRRIKNHGDRTEYLRTKQQESRARKRAVQEKEKGTEKEKELTESETETESTLVNTCQHMSTPTVDSHPSVVPPAVGLSLHDRAEMIANAVIDGTGLTGRWVRGEIVKQAEHELKTNPDANMDNVTDGMIYNRRKFEACCHDNRIRNPQFVSPERFFSDGLWKDKTKWNFKKGASDNGIAV